MLRCFLCGLGLQLWVFNLMGFLMMDCLIYLFCWFEFGFWFDDLRFVLWCVLIWFAVDWLIVYICWWIIRVFTVCFLFCDRGWLLYVDVLMLGLCRCVALLLIWLIIIFVLFTFVVCCLNGLLPWIIVILKLLCWICCLLGLLMVWLVIWFCDF